MTTQSEQILETGLVKTLQDIGYEYVLLREEDNLDANFKSQLEKHNKSRLAQINKATFTDKEFEKICIHLEGGTRFEKAKKLRDLYPLDTEDGQRVWIEFLNKNKWCKNEFQVASQVTTEGRRKGRHDVTILINGLPLVQIEIKRRGTELKGAYKQVRDYYKHSFSGLFDYIQLFVISNGTNTRYCANNLNNDYKFTFNWTDAENVPFNDLDKFAHSFLEKCDLGKMISKYIVLHNGDKCLMALRPYQYYAVERMLDRIANTNKNGYIWHTTGAGKTLTSFKAAQLASEIDGIDKVMFVVDRRDLDMQTQSEYQAFEPGAVDSTDNTYELIKRLSGDSKIIITTIQKLNNAVTKDAYNKHLQKVQHQRVVIIFDECHRSQFGESHKNICQFFTHHQIFGFTGTPIFEENANEHTTAQIFGECLHRYLIKDAIADDNVLGFLVEYYQGKNDLGEDYMHQTRMKEIAKFILANFDKSTFSGEFNAIFATQSIPALLKYYQLFKALHPTIRIGAVFSYGANTNQYDEPSDAKAATENEIQLIMDDYNRMFGTSFTPDNFSLYYEDINLRMKKKKPDMKPLDLLLVVNMFLTGFDAKKLNTLYVDKNLEYHGLVQAFSRTNRVLNEKKRFGKIICFRNLKNNVDDAIKLFSNNAPSEYIIREPFEKVKTAYNELAAKLKAKYPDAQYIDALQSEYDKRDFVLAFREILRKRREIEVYEDFDANDETLLISEEEYMNFRSKYLDIAVGNIDGMDTSPEEDDTDISDDESDLDDIDFCLELLHSDIINVAYILNLIVGLSPLNDGYLERRKEIIDTMIRDAAMRKKAKLIDDFIRKTVDDDKEGFEKAKSDGTMDLESRFVGFITKERNNAVLNLSQEEDIDIQALHNFLTEYDYLSREKTAIIQDAVKEKKVGLIERRAILERVINKLRTIIDKFNWD